MAARWGVRSLTIGLFLVLALGGAGCWFVRPAPVIEPQAGSGPAASAPAKAPADNSPCEVCHMDFVAEELTVQHVKGGVGCTDCHGKSEAHGGDEWNIISPDILFGRAEIDSFCKSCHPTHSTGETYNTFVKKWSGKRRPNGRPVDQNSVCTDCHGTHAVLTPAQQAAVPAE